MGGVDIIIISIFEAFLFIVVVQSLSCDPMECSTPGFPVLDYLPEYAQICVH